MSANLNGRVGGSSNVDEITSPLTTAACCDFFRSLVDQQDNQSHLPDGFG